MKRSLNSLRPTPNRRHFADDIFKCILENENEWISPRISLKFVPNVRINSIPALVHTMAWRRSGGKPLSEPMMVGLPTHICVTRPQWAYQVVMVGFLVITHRECLFIKWMGHPEQKVFVLYPFIDSGSSPFQDLYFTALYQSNAPK